MADRSALVPVEWMGSSLRDLRAFPEDVQDEVGYALYLAQLGGHARSAKRLGGTLSGLVEFVDDFDGDTYRAVYTMKLKGAVYVLHVFQKKSTRGVSTPRHHVDLIRERLTRAREHHAVHYAAQERL